MNYKNIIYTAMKPFLLAILILTVVVSCDTDELPEEGTIPDETPPSAAFSISDVDSLTYSFANLSSSATDYSWDFGDGNTSTDVNPSHTYGAIGQYTITLTATDKLNVSDNTSQSIEIFEPGYCPDIQLFIGDPCDDGDPETLDDTINEACQCGGEVPFQPIISEFSFEDDSDVIGCGDNAQDGRDCWRNNDLGGVIQITSGPTFDGEQAAKLPTAGDRVGYQLITVLPERDYTLNFYYTMKTSPVGTLTVSILGGAVSDPTLVTEATIASVELNDQSDANTYVSASLPFNSGSSSEVAIYFNNVDVECRLDLFSIE